MTTAKDGKGNDVVTGKHNRNTGSRSGVWLGVLLGLTVVVGGVGIAGSTSARPASRVVESASEDGSTAPVVSRPARPQRETGARIDRTLDQMTRVSRAVASGATLDRDALSAAWEELQASALLATARLDAIEARLIAHGGSAQALERLARARAAHREKVLNWVDALEPAITVLVSGAATKVEGLDADRARAALSELLPQIETVREVEKATPILRASQLPFRRASLPPRSPVVELTVVPSYLDAAGVEPSAADLAGSSSAPLAEDVLLQAEALGYDPVRIVEYVRNEIATEWYAGSMRGALGTLRAGRGNDVDQASLLIALLRASRAGARYVHGVIELPIVEAANRLGVDENHVVDALARAGIAHEPVIQGGTVGAVRLAHTWVSAHLPYTNYRGAVVDFSGRTWVPLMPSLRAVARTPATRVLDDMAFSANAFVAAYVTAPQSQEPLDLLRSAVEAHLADLGEGGTFDGQLATATPTVEVLGLVPSSANVSVVAITGEQAALDDRHRHWVSIIVPDSGDPQAPPLLDVTLAVDALSSAERLTISYLPATVDDDDTVNLFGGLGQVPAFLVDVRPQVKVDGKVRATGAATGLGVAHELVVALRAPWDDGASGGGERIAQTVIAGSYLAIGIGAPQHVPSGPSIDDPNDTEHQGARLLGSVAREYAMRWDAAEATLADLLDVQVFRPLPSVALVINRVSVASLFGLPEQVVWDGVDLDAALRVAEPIARPDGDAGGVNGDASREWLKLAALQGSALEHRVFEDEFQVESLSADKGLALAHQAGMAVVTVDAGNLASVLPTLGHPQGVLDEVVSCVQAGLTVEIPVVPVTLLAWQGAVWRAFVPSGSGAAGYFIAGGLADPSVDPLAGGATAAAPGSWPVPAIEQVLSDPYEPEPNDDPLSAVAIEKLNGTDAQEGTVAKLSEPLAVRVVDAEDRPVVGALVTFEVFDGGGQLRGPGGTGVASLVVQTDRQGLASATLRYGQRTDVDPVFVLRDAADEWDTRAGRNRVDARVVTPDGDVGIDTPFELLAYPDEPAELYTGRAGTNFLYDRPGFWSDTVGLEIRDRFENPISNAAIRARVLDADTESNACLNSDHDPDNAVVIDARLVTDGYPASCDQQFPVLGDCGAALLDLETASNGAFVGIITGSSSQAIYAVELTPTGLDPVVFRYAPRSFTPNGFCRASDAPRAFASGSAARAARAGETVAVPLDAHFVSWCNEFQFSVAAQPPPTYGSIPLTSGAFLPLLEGAPTFEVSGNGAAAPAFELSDGVFRTWITTGLQPGTQTVSFTNPETIWQRCTPNNDQGMTEIINVDYDAWVQRFIDVGSDLFRDFRVPRPLTQVVAVEPTLEAPRPAKLQVDGNTGRASAAFSFDYTILPLDYAARDTVVLLQEVVNGEGTTLALARGTSNGVGGRATFQLFEVTFEPEVAYQAVLVLNPGAVDEIRSDPQPVPLGLPIIRDYERGLSVAIDVDILNGRSCATPTTFDFDLVQEATVTLAFRAIEAVETSGEPIVSDSAITLVDGQTFAAGPHSVPVTVDDLPAGRYRMELTAVNVDGEVEEVQGSAISSQQVRDRLPVGHLRHRDVNLFNGSLVVGREDLSLPGRGVPLAFRRNYASSSSDEAGWMGVGWSHSYESLLIETGCGEMVVTGGEGAGTRFAPGPNGFVPLSGFHGSLELESDGFAYTTKSGNRYLYVPFANGRYRLQTISDPNGNATTIAYAEGQDATKVLSVTDRGGRALLFSYTLTALPFEGPRELLTAVRGPYGMAVTFDYDAFGNLIEAEREALRRETYAYDVQNGSPLRQHLVRVHNESRGGTRLFDYAPFSAQVGTEVTLAQQRVTETRWSVTNAGALPAEGRATFDYDLVANTTSVLDTFDAETHYTFNTYGSPLRIVDPEQNETLMVWAANDVLLEQRTDGNGTVTDFAYDEHGNLLTESVTVSDYDNQTHVYTMARTYHPPGDFEQPIKDRVATATDRAGGVTRFRYDPKGNLLEERIVVDEAAGGTATYVTAHTYLPNGDRRSTTDPRDQTTFFEYDVHGNRTLEIDPLGGTTAVTWDIRSRPISSTNARLHTTRFGYDTLGRLTATTYPDDTQERIIYVDLTREERRFDALNRQSTTFFDYEGRPVHQMDASESERFITYDEEGRKISETTFTDDATDAQTITYEYDLAGRLIRRTEPLGRITEFVYDGVGNVVRETLSDASGSMTPRVTEQDWDALNRPITSRRSLSTSATGFVERHMRWDGEGRKIEAVDPLGRVMTMRYDQLGRLIETIEPAWRPGAARTTQRRYDGNGNLLETTLFNETDGNVSANQVRSQTFDALNRLATSRDAENAVTVLSYDAVGNVIRDVDGRGHVVEHDYDQRDRRIRTRVKLDQITVPARDVVTEFGYDAVGNRTEERWPNGNVITHTFDELNRLVSSTDRVAGAASAIVAYDYDARSNRVLEVDGNGHETVIVYDALDRVVERRLPENRTVTATWDVAGNQLTETNPRTLTRSFVYDELNRLVQTTDPAPLAYVRTMEYDDAGNKTAEIDGRGGRVDLVYDDLNRVTQRTEPALADGTRYVTTMAYDAADNLVEEVDRRGIVTAFAYDRENRRIETRRAGLLLETRQYDDNGNVVFTTDANTNTVGFDYDERNLQIAVNRSLASITRFTYDDMGDRVATTDPENRVVREGYDVRRRLASRTVEGPSGDETTTFTYDLVGNQLTRSLPESGLWQSSYDDANRLVEVTDPEQGTTSYVYDPNGNLTSWTDGAQHTTTQAYDEVDRLVERRYEDGAFETLAYDANSNVTSRIDPQGRETVSTFDALNRATVRTYAEDTSTTDDLTSTSFVYDANNNLLTVTETYAVSGAQTDTRTYDDFDRVQAVTDRFGKMLQYGYDANGNRTQLIEPADGTGSAVTLYAYDALNRLSSATTDAGVTTYDYLRNSLLDRITYPNGSGSQYGYDEANRVAQIDNLHDTVLISRFEYTYDRNGNRIEQVETHSGVASPETTTYEYDLADRLTEVTYPDERVSYTYDGAGNRESEVTFATSNGALLSSKTLTYNSRNQVTRLEDSEDPSVAVTYGYDATGNQISRALDSGGVTTFTYDVRDRMIGVAQDAAPVATYGYDAQGLRISKTVEGVEVRYLYDGQSVLNEFEPSGTTLRRYAYGSDRLLSIDDVNDGRGYYLFDALGSVVDITSDAGTLLAMYQYDAWGNTRNEAGSSSNNYGFTGHEHDDETGLIYAKARFYDPELGRFLSHDPVDGDLTNPPSLHKYLYAFQNPTVFVDPDGKRAFTPEEIRNDSERIESSRAELERLQASEKSFLTKIKSGDVVGNEGLALGQLAIEIQQLQGRISALEARIAEQATFLGQVEMLVENKDNAEARKVALVEFLQSEGLDFDDSVRRSNQFLAPLACDENCQILGEIGSLAPAVKVLELIVLASLEGAGGVALGSGILGARRAAAARAAVNSADDTVAFERAQRALDDAFEGLSRSQRRRQGGATSVGAADFSSGRTAIGTSDGGVPRDLVPELKKRVDELGGVENVCKNKPGVCAEIDAANQLMKMGSRIEDVRFSTPIRPRNLRKIGVCENCQRVFSDEQFAPGTTFDQRQ